MESERTSLWRNPFLWAFFIGIVTITALRPFLIHRPDPPPVGWQLPEYRLIDQRGEPFGSADLAGDVYVASFFFTSCPSICPKLMQQLGRLRDKYDEDGVDGIRMVGITVDPERDTPEILGRYGEALGIDPDRWLLLTGDPAEIRDLLVNGFKVAMGDPDAPSDVPYDIAHSGKLVIVDARGGHRGFYDHDDTGLEEVFHRSRHVLEDTSE